MQQQLVELQFETFFRTPDEIIDHDICAIRSQADGQVSQLEGFRSKVAHHFLQLPFMEIADQQRFINAFTAEALGAQKIEPVAEAGLGIEINAIVDAVDENSVSGRSAPWRRLPS